MSTKEKSSRYSYRALDAAGKSSTGVISATSPSAAHGALLERGLQPLTVSVKNSIWKFEITRKKVPRKDVMNFTRQLAVFIRAGVPIMDALEVIAEETSGKMMKPIVADIIDALRRGDTFSDAAGMHPEAFPTYYVGILGSAELTGNLDVVLEQLAAYIERDLKARSTITSALIYPAVVLVMSIITVGVLSVFVLPRFVVFFASLHAKLPVATRALIGFSHFVSHSWIVIVILVVALVIAIGALRRVAPGRAAIDAFILRLPVLGDLARTAILERICRILASLLGAGVDLPRSMTVTADSSNNDVYRRALMKIRDEVMAGRGLTGPINESGLFPGAARQMIRVGEETGTLDRQLEVAANYYSRELEDRLERTTALFEPAIIIVMGLIVGFVAVALVSAMYGIYSQVKVG
jgi:type IV pilus assembly protein PilC